MSRVFGAVDSVENPDNDKEESLKRLDDLKAGFDLLKNLLAKMESVYSVAESVLHDELGKRSRMIEAKDAALAELKQGLLLQLRELKEQLNAKDELLRNRDGELESLRSEVNAWAQRAAESDHAKEDAERMLREELDKGQSALEAKEVALAELERSYNLRLREVENHLRAKEDLLKDRDGQIEELRSEVNALAQRLSGIKSEAEQTESLLRQELGRKTSLLEGKDSAIAEMEEAFTGRIKDLENQLNAKASLLQNHDVELEELRSEVLRLTEDLAEAAADKDQSETSLREELRKKDDMLQAINSAMKIKELKESLSAKIQNEEGQVAQEMPVDPFEILVSK
jgi:chromosome segregation ATPase